MATSPPSPTALAALVASEMSLSIRSPHEISDRPIKRRRTSPPIDVDAMISSRTSVSINSGVPRAEREIFFDALETMERFPGAKRVIEGPEDLERLELKALFELLHALGQTIDEAPSLAKTRQSVESFLEAIFTEWRSGNVEDPRPELDLAVAADVIAGRVCMAGDQHANISACLASEICTSDITAVATYTTCPPAFRLEYNMSDPHADGSQTICALTRSDIHWVTSNWTSVLRSSLQCKIDGKILRHNKRLAIWHARRMVQAWADGSVEVMPENGRRGFLMVENITTVLRALLGSG